MTIVGSNWGERPTFGGIPFNVPSALSNSAAIQAGDLIFLAMETSDGHPSSSDFTRLYLTSNVADAFFVRTATGSETAGWTFTSDGAVNESWSFVVVRGFSIEGTPGGTGLFDGSWASASQTSVAATLAVLMRTNHANISGATLSDPSGMTLDVLSAVTNQDPTVIQTDCWHQTITPGSAVSYSGTYATNAGTYGTTLVLLAPSGGGGGGPVLPRRYPLPDRQAPDDLPRRGRFAPPSGLANITTAPSKQRYLISEDLRLDDRGRHVQIPVSGVAASNLPVARTRASAADEFAIDYSPRRLWVPVSGVVATPAPTMRGRATIDELAPQDTPQRAPGAAATMPQVDSVLPLVGYDTSDLEQANREESMLRPRLAPASGPIAATLPLRGRTQQQPEMLADDIQRKPAPLVTFAPQAPGPLRLPRIARDEGVPDDRMPGRSPLITYAPQAPAPLRAARPLQIDDAPPAEAPPVRDGIAPLQSVAVAPGPLVAHRPVAEDTTTDDQRRRVQIPASGIAPMAAPNTRPRPVVDDYGQEALQRKPWAPPSGAVASAPPTVRARANAVDDGLADDAQRRVSPLITFAPQAPAPAARRPAQLDEPAPIEAIPERDGVAPLQVVGGVPPLPNRRTREETTTDEATHRISQAPTPTTAALPPLVVRGRAIIEAQVEETISRKPQPLPASGIAPSLPPIFRRRFIEDGLTLEEERRALRRMIWLVYAPFLGGSADASSIQQSASALNRGMQQTAKASSIVLR